MVRLLSTIALFLSLFSSFSFASDPSPLQDFCVAVNGADAAVFVNGKICKKPNMVVAEDFFYKAGNTRNPVGSRVTPANVNQAPGLNALGICLVRLNHPHRHPRATEILVMVQGTLYVGFVTSNPANPDQKNQLFTKTLCAGDILGFPQGLIHYQFNTRNTSAIAFAGLRAAPKPHYISIYHQNSAESPLERGATFCTGLVALNSCLLNSAAAVHSLQLFLFNCNILSICDI